MPPSPWSRQRFAPILAAQAVDASFAAGSPARATSPGTAVFQGSALGGGRPLPGHDYLLDARSSEGGRLDRREREPAVACHQVWGMPTDLLVVGHGRKALPLFSDASRQDVGARDDPALDLIQHHVPPTCDGHPPLAPREPRGYAVQTG